MLTLDKMLIRQGDFSLTADWTLARGKKLSVIGPSGAGKSTLLAAIAGFQIPQSGSIRLDGKDMRGVLPGDRPVSLLFQDHNLFPHLSVAQNVGLGRSPKLKLTAEDETAIARVLERVGLPDSGARKPATLSGGQLQRVALARALIRNKPLLMLDEPFAALGPGLKQDMLTLVDEITTETGMTLIMVTHSPADARQISDLTSLVDDGKALPPLNSIEMFASPSPQLARYLGTH